MNLPLRISPFVIRPFRPGDEPSLQSAANDWEIAKWLRDAFPHPYTLEDAYDWVAHAGSQAPLTELAIADGDGDEIVGSVGFRVQEDMLRHSAEVGYWVARSHWGRGIASRSLAAIVGHAFEHFDLNRLFAGVKEGNEASLRVLRANGFVLEGRLREAITGRQGETKDELVYGLLRSDWARRMETS